MTPFLRCNLPPHKALLGRSEYAGIRLLSKLAPKLAPEKRHTLLNAAITALIAALCFGDANNTDTEC